MDDWGLPLLGLLGVAGGGLKLMADWNARQWADRADARRALVGLVSARYQPRYTAGGNLTVHEAVGAGPPLLSPPMDLPALVAEAGLPGLTTLGALGFVPSAAAILLGLGPGGTRLTVPAGDALCHIALGGKTGTGKSNLLRLLLTQLAAAGCETYLCDPHFAPINPTTGDDWRGIAAATVPGRAITDKAEIVALVAGLGAELDRRLARWGNSLDPGPARFYAIEELPLLTAYDKDFMPKLGRLLREGRKLGLYLMVAAQDLLVSTLGGSSGLRAQFQTLYYGGGDPITARTLLGSKQIEPPGKGVVWLRSAATGNEPTLVRVPLVENADILRLLPAPASVASARFSVVSGTAPLVSGEVVEVSSETSARRAEVRRRLGLKQKFGDIVAEVWGVRAGGSAAYQAAYDEMQQILADLATAQEVA